MKFTETKLKDVWLVEIEKIGDHRGYFGRAWCQLELKERGLNAEIKQINSSFSPHKGILRGLHYQARPFEEVKLVRCIQGRIFDVVVDLRPESPTFMQWDGFELTAENGSMLYVPEQCATGFVTLEDHCSIYYTTSQYYTPDAVRGLRYNDSAFSIDWPVEITCISDADRDRMDFHPEQVS